MHIAKNDIISQFPEYLSVEKALLQGVRLSPMEVQTVADIETFEAANGLVELADADDADGERRSGVPHVRGNHGYVIGVDIGGSNLRVALADLNGTILDRCAFPTKPNAQPESLVREIQDCVENLLERTSIPRSSLLAVGAGAPGITDVETGIVIATSYLMGWRNVPLRDLLESAFQIPASVENDVNLAAIGEYWIGAARSVRDFVFLAIGSGIGAGIFLNCQLLHGTDWTAGEIGYMLVPGTPDIGYEQGEPGSLESVIGGKGIELQWQRACQDGGDPLLQNLTATEIFDRAETGDCLAKSMLDQTSQILSYAVLNTSLIVNCSLFVLGGGVGMSRPLFSATQRILDRRNGRIRLRLAQSILGPDAQLMGAIRLALDKAESLIAIPQ